jgi:hypothetical protein
MQLRRANGRSGALFARLVIGIGASLVMIGTQRGDPSRWEAPTRIRVGTKTGGERG